MRPYHHPCDKKSTRGVHYTVVAIYKGQRKVLARRAPPLAATRLANRARAKGFEVEVTPASPGMISAPMRTGPFDTAHPRGSNGGSPRGARPGHT